MATHTPLSPSAVPAATDTPQQAEAASAGPSGDGILMLHGKRSKPPSMPADVVLRSQFIVEFDSGSEPLHSVRVDDKSVTVVIVMGIGDGNSLTKKQQTLLLGLLQKIKASQPAGVLSLCKGGVNRSCLFKCLAQIDAGQMPDPFTGNNDYFAEIVRLAKASGNVKQALADAVKPSMLRPTASRKRGRAE